MSIGRLEEMHERRRVRNPEWDDEEVELRARRAALVDGHARLGRGLGRGEREPLAVVRGDEVTLRRPVSGLMSAPLCTGCATASSQSARTRVGWE